MNRSLRILALVTIPSLSVAASARAAESTALPLGIGYGGWHGELRDAPKKLETFKAIGFPMVAFIPFGRGDLCYTAPVSDRRSDPLADPSALEAASALVVAWLPGTEGGGIADVLFGAVKPTGKLPCSWPRDMAQIPINVGDPGYAPLFEYGFGLGW